MNRPARALVWLTIDAPAWALNKALDLASLREHAARLEDENTRLRYERDTFQMHADRLVEANRDLCRVIHELTSLDDEDDDAAGYEPAAPVYGPAAEQLVAKFREEIEAWGGEEA